MNNFDLRKYLAEGKLIKEDIDREIVSYIADTYIQNAKDGDRRYANFSNLNIKDAVQDVLGILQSSGHPLHDETKEEYSIVKRDKAKGIFETEGSSLKEDIDMSSKDGYIAFIDNENILGTYGLEDAEEMARELAMNHHDAGRDQDNFVKSFMAAYKEGGYMNDN